MGAPVGTSIHYVFATNMFSRNSSRFLILLNVTLQKKNHFRKTFGKKCKNIFTTEYLWLYQFKEQNRNCANISFTLVRKRKIISDDVAYVLHFKHDKRIHL